MAAPAAALLAIMNLQHNNQQGAGSRGTSGSGARSNSVQAANGASDTKATTPQRYLNDCRSFYSCLYCRAHLANHDELISRSFQGNRSRAYLFNTVINITTGAAVQRELNTGSHAVADIYCSNCGTTVGWKYERAYVDSQKYKEGKFIIELAHVVRENRHLELDKRDMFLALHLGSQAAAPAMAAPPAAAAPSGARRDAHGLRPTIAQVHRGSQSPLSNSADSRWSSGLSSASSQGGGGNGDDRARGDLLARRSEPIGLYEFEQHERDSQDDDDEQEVLMFPFHDDLYGERASYYNLSMSRLSYRGRNRRSLHLNSTPYDWKYSTRPTASLGLEPHCSREQSESESQPAASSSSLPTVGASRQEMRAPLAHLLGATSNATRHAQLALSQRIESGADADEKDEERQSGDRDEHEIQFELDPSESCDTSAERLENSHPGRANKRTRLELRPGSAWHCGAAPSATASSSVSHEQVEMVVPRDSDPRATTDSGQPESVVVGCLGADDEEFYDCCSGELQASKS